MDYEQVIEKLKRWATADDRIRALVLTGSGATGATHPLSDRDIEVVTTAVEELLDDESWWMELGDVLVVERLENADGNPTRLAYYVGGKIDFTLLTPDQLGARTYDRPAVFLLDKDGLAADLDHKAPEWEHPRADENEESIHWAYAAALMSAKGLVRGELWPAKLRDNDLKEHLLEMIEWDHRPRYGGSYDTRYLATRMNEWMDQDIRMELSSCWGHFDARDSALALRRTVALYRRVAERTTNFYGLDVRVDSQKVADEIEAILSSGNI